MVRVEKDDEYMSESLYVESAVEQPLVYCRGVKVVLGSSHLNRKAIYLNEAQHFGSRAVSQSISRVVVRDYHEVVRLDECKSHSATSMVAMPGLNRMLR